MTVFMYLFHLQPLKQILIEVLNPCFVHVLCRLHGAYEESGGVFEFGETSVVVHLVLVIDDEGHDAVAKTFAEEDETTDTSVAILEGVDALEAPVVFGKGMDGYVLLGIVPLAE